MFGYDVLCLAYIHASWHPDKVGVRIDENRRLPCAQIAEPVRIRRCVVWGARWLHICFGLTRILFLPWLRCIA
jgi:hypothetical protein